MIGCWLTEKRMGFGRANVPSHAGFARVAYLLLPILCGCATGGAASRAPVPSSEIESSCESCAFAAGEQVRREHANGFTVFPTFLGRDGEVPPSSDTSSVRRRIQLLTAFRRGTGARLADTLAYQDSVKLAALPSSARFFFTLANEPDVRGDTALVDVFGGNAAGPGEPLDRELLRYVFVKSSAGWRFVRRTLLYAA
jgi:hypothetical protein